MTSTSPFNQSGFRMPMKRRDGSKVSAPDDNNKMPASSFTNSELYQHSHSNSYCNQIIDSYVKKLGQSRKVGVNSQATRTATSWVKEYGEDFRQFSDSRMSNFRRKNQQILNKYLAEQHKNQILQNKEIQNRIKTR